MTTRYWPAHQPAAAPAPTHGCAPAGATPFGVAARLLEAQARDRALQLARIRQEIATPAPVRFIRIEKVRHA